MEKVRTDSRVSAMCQRRWCSSARAESLLARRTPGATPRLEISMNSTLIRAVWLGR